MQTIAPTSRRQGQEQPGDYIIQVRGVNKQFGKNKPFVVRDLNFEVRRGEIFCLLGPSGSGKSTTMRMLTGVYKPSEGQIRVLGIEPSRFKKRTRAQIGYMPQQFVLFPELSTLENINFVGSVYGMSWFGRRKKVREALQFVDLWDARDRLAAQLSGGMQRRLELASTLIHRPKLIFVDEPTAGVDPVLRAKFWEHFESLRQEGRTLFVTTQYVTEADYCDTVAILNRGRLLAYGSPEDIRQEAMGGEIIDLTLEEVTGQAVRLLRRIPDMRRIQIVSTENMRLTVGSSGEALPEIMEAFRQNNLNIQSIEPYRPNFEEVFVQLMEQDVEEDEEDEGGENTKQRERDTKQRAAQPEPQPAPAQHLETRPPLENSPRLEAMPVEPRQSVVRERPQEQARPQPPAPPTPDLRPTGPEQTLHGAAAPTPRPGDDTLAMPAINPALNNRPPETIEPVEQTRTSEPDETNLPGEEVYARPATDQPTLPVPKQRSTQPLSYNGNPVPPRAEEEQR